MRKLRKGCQNHIRKGVRKGCQSVIVRILKIYEPYKNYRNFFETLASSSLPKT